MDNLSQFQQGFALNSTIQDVISATKILVYLYSRVYICNWKTH